jgi:gamma-glutamylaminecyclotransferase
MSAAVGAETLPLFVYGTLKRGLPNHRHLPPALSFLSAARTSSPLPLVVGPHGIPFLLDMPSHLGARRVRGELYTAPAAALAALDAFEGVDTSFYQRVVLDVEREGKLGPSLRAWAYVRAPGGGGPAWVREWTVEKLSELECMDDYTKETAAAGFAPRDMRESK